MFAIKSEIYHLNLKIQVFTGIYRDLQEIACNFPYNMFSYSGNPGVQSKYGKIVADESLVFQREYFEYQGEQDKKFQTILRESFNELGKLGIEE